MLSSYCKITAIYKWFSEIEKEAKKNDEIHIVLYIIFIGNL